MSFAQLVEHLDVGRNAEKKTCHCQIFEDMTSLHERHTQDGLLCHLVNAS